MVHLRKMMISPRSFFHFSKTLILWVVKEGGGVKGQKMVQNEKKFCLSRSISQEAYIIWLSFEVHRCNMMISPGICYIFSKFWIFWFLGGWVTKKKMIHNYQFQSVTLSNSRTVDHIMKIVGTQVWNNDISRCFSLFFFFLNTTL